MYLAQVIGTVVSTSKDPRLVGFKLLLTRRLTEEGLVTAAGLVAHGIAGTLAIMVLATTTPMVDVLTWRWLFAVPIVLVAFSAFMTKRYVPNSADGSDHRFDVGGSLLSMLAIGSLIMGIHEGPERGWTDPITLAGLGIGLAALIGFIVWERRQDEPLLVAGDQ